MLEGRSGTERRLQRSRRGLARTTRSLHRSTGARITLLYTVSGLACSYVILNGTLAKVRWQYCAESGCRTLTSRDITSFTNTRFMHTQKERCLEEFGYLAYVPCVVAIDPMRREQAGGRTARSPSTNLPLASTSLTPNRTLKSVICEAVDLELGRGKRARDGAEGEGEGGASARPVSRPRR